MLFLFCNVTPGGQLFKILLTGNGIIIVQERYCNKVPEGQNACNMIIIVLFTGLFTHAIFDTILSSSPMHFCHKCKITVISVRFRDDICWVYLSCSNPLCYRGDKLSANHTEIGASLHLRFTSQAQA